MGFQKGHKINLGKQNSLGYRHSEKDKKKMRGPRLSMCGKNHPKWKDGKYKGTQGYILVYSPEHPNKNHQGYVFEHRLVMEKKRNRYLEREEIVHHKNGLRDDNRPENLELFAKGHHSGHQIICPLCSYCIQ